MSFVWDSNILRHYLEDHPLLLENLTKVPRQHVVLPTVVAAEQRGVGGAGGAYDQGKMLLGL